MHPFKFSKRIIRRLLRGSALLTFALLFLQFSLQLTLQPTASLGRASTAYAASDLQTVQAATPSHEVDATQTSVPDEYALRPLASGSGQDSPQSSQSYLGLNPAHGLQIIFGPEDLAITSLAHEEVKWRVSLELDSLTRGNAHPQPVAAANSSIAHNQIQYERNQIHEWYINSADGLKQGFTLHERPFAAAGNAPLYIHMAVSGTLRPRLGIDGKSIDLVTGSGALLLRYDSLVVYDANGAMVPASLAVRDRNIIIAIDDRAAVYPILVDPLLTNHLVKQRAPDAAANDFHGYDVNVSEGIGMVGAYGDDNENGIDAGTVYLYDQHLGGAFTWNQSGRLVASDGQPGDQFGRDVYVHFGYTVTVGAPGHDALGADAGAAYLFSRHHGGANQWSELTKLTASNGAAGDEFGAAVTTQRRTTVIGAPRNDANGADAGAAYVFELLDATQPTVWTETTILAAPQADAGDHFGAAVVNTGDFIFIGAPGDDSGCPADPNENPDCNSGAVYLFERNFNGEAWGMRHKLVPSAGSAGARFGTSINVSTDRIIVGAPGDSEKGVNAGAAYIFERNRDGLEAWGLRAKITAPDGAANDQFGRAVGIGGNIAIIGAPFNDENGNDAGAAYLVFFRLADGQGEWGRTAKIIASDGNAGDHFGMSVDQRSGQIVIGSPMANTSGATYFHRTPFDVGTLQVASNVEPNASATNWNYAWSGPLTYEVSTTGDNQSTPAMLFPGTYTVTLTPGANTDLAPYTTSWRCTKDGAAGPSGLGTTLTIYVGMLENVSCTFTHLSAGTISIVNHTRPEGGSGFNFTDNIAAPNSFTLNGGETKTFTEVTPDAYEVSAVIPADWRLTGIECIDPDNGTQVNSASVTIDLDAGEAIECTFSSKSKDGISVAMRSSTNIAKVGQSIIYTYTIVNDSQDELTNVAATDNRLGSVPLAKSTLAPGEEIVGTLEYAVQAGDLPGPLVNTVTVTGTPPASPVVTDEASHSVAIVGEAAIALQATADINKAGINDRIRYSYRVTNTGTAPLNIVSIIDDRLGAVPITDPSLQPGESTDGTLLYTVVESDLPGPLVDTVSVVGKPPVGDEVAAEAVVTVELVVASGIEVTIEASNKSAKVGDTVTYTYRVTNSGEDTLNEITAQDDFLGSVSLDKTTLAPSESAVGTLTYTVVEEDLPGPMTNTVEASATSEFGGSVQAEASVSVTLEPLPAEETPQIFLPSVEK